MVVDVDGYVREPCSAERAALDRDTLMCTIYENRPLICREFEMASNECLTERAASM